MWLQSYCSTALLGICHWYNLRVFAKTDSSPCNTPGIQSFTSFKCLLMYHHIRKDFADLKRSKRVYTSVPAYPAFISFFKCFLTHGTLSVYLLNRLLYFPPYQNLSIMKTLVLFIQVTKYLRHLVQGQAHRRCSVNTCWISESNSSIPTNVKLHFIQQKLYLIHIFIFLQNQPDMAENTSQCL